MADFGTIKLGKKALILVSVPLAFEVFFAVVLLNMVQNSERETQRAEHSRLVYVYADTMVRRLYQIGMATYARSTIGGDLFSCQYDKAVQKIKDDLLKLRAMCVSKFDAYCHAEISIQAKAEVIWTRSLTSIKWYDTDCKH